MNARAVILKYGAEYRAPDLSTSGIPASTRIIDAIVAMEKDNKPEGQRWMAMLFEFKRWVEIKARESA
jgi:hypothetical protein